MCGMLVWVVGCYCGFWGASVVVGCECRVVCEMLMWAVGQGKDTWCWRAVPTL